MSSTQHVLLSPAELAYLHDSLSLTPPIRPDGRAPNQFRPLTAETGILPGTNGSARVCFADGTEAVVGVKAEVEKTRERYGAGNVLLDVVTGKIDDDSDEEDGEGGAGSERKGESDWVELTVEIPGLRDDDANTVFLAAMLTEALLVDGEFVKRLWINRRFHWKLYLDVRSSLSLYRRRRILGSIYTDKTTYVWTSDQSLAGQHLLATRPDPETADRLPRKTHAIPGFMCQPIHPV